MGTLTIGISGTAIQLTRTLSCFYIPPDVSILTKFRFPSEWYRSYGHLRHLLNPIYFATATGTTESLKGKDISSAQVAKRSLVDEGYTFPRRDKARILIVGCGNSAFGADMLRDGWGGRIENIDFSSVRRMLIFILPLTRSCFSRW